MKIEINEKDVWQKLKEDGKPTVIYGMGDAAERIIKILKENGIEPNDIFASDEFVRSHSFLGKRCLNIHKFVKNTKILILCLPLQHTFLMCLTG